MTNPVIPPELVCFSLRLLSVILSVLVKTMILLVVAFVLQWIMRNASPKLRHGLWLSAIFCCLLVLGLSLRGPLYQVGPRPSNGAVSPLSALSSALVPPAGSFAVGRDLPPIASVVWRPTPMPTLWPSLWPPLVLFFLIAGAVCGWLRMLGGGSSLRVRGVEGKTGLHASMTGASGSFLGSWESGARSASWISRALPRRLPAASCARRSFCRRP